jgi:hypothetical protein
MVCREEVNEVREGELLGVDLALSSSSLYACAPRHQFPTNISIGAVIIFFMKVFLKGTIRPDWICMRVVSLDRP